MKADNPAARDALQARLDAGLKLHERMGWYEECTEHQEPEDDDGDYWDAHFRVSGGSFVTCEQNRVGDVCRCCTGEEAYANEGPTVAWPCVTHNALTGENASAGEGR